MEILKISKGPLVLVILLVFLGLGNSQDLENKVSHREPKILLSVSVPPSPCGSAGVCLPKKQCGKRSGVLDAVPSCNNGFGQCCKFTEQCNSTRTGIDISQYVTTLTNPTDLTTSCTFRIKKQTNVCQIKLDFVAYTSDSADGSGECATDSFSVSGTNTVPEGFKTCGTLTGQHMYLSYGSSDTIELRPSFAANKGNYIITVTQIPCNSPQRVPGNCLQYYSKTTDRVKSFDYGGQQQNNQKYTVCVGGLDSPNSISWRPCSGEVEPFLIAGNPAVPTQCDSQDWVQVNGLNQICTWPGGDGANALPLKSTFAPFLLNVYFNDVEIPVLPPMPTELQNLAMTDCDTANFMSGEKFAQYSGMINCVWQTAPGPPYCDCSFLPAFLQVLGVANPDTGNTGFCLDYTQS